MDPLRVGLEISIDPRGCCTEREGPPSPAGAGAEMGGPKGRRPRVHPPPRPAARPQREEPHYPWARGRTFLFCVQHRGEEGADEAPYPVLVHDEDSHRGRPCRGPGHDAPGTARHIYACSAIAAVAYALGVGDYQARRWWDRGWVLVEGAPSPSGAAPPPGGALRRRRRIWDEGPGAALIVPPGKPRPQERHYVPLQWCVRAPVAEAPLTAQVHACQDHQGRPCFAAAPWLPAGHRHVHVVARSPAGAISSALGICRRTALRLVQREGAVALEGPTAARFRATALEGPTAARFREGEGPAPPPPEGRGGGQEKRGPSIEGPAPPPPEGRSGGQGKGGISVSLSIEAPWSY